MKKMLIVEEPESCETCPLRSYSDLMLVCTPMREAASDVECPLKHPLKHVSNDFYIYDTKYLMKNLDREINLLKGTKSFRKIMEKKNESNIRG